MDFVKWIRAQWDRSAAVVAFVAGIISLLAGWFGASDTTNPGVQIPYVISGGLFGIFLLGTATTLWLSADMKDEWRKLDDLHQSVRR